MKFFNISLARSGFRLGMTGLVLFVLQGCTGAGSSDGGGGGGGGQSARAACLANDANYVNTFLSALTTNHAAQGGQLYDKWWAALGFGSGPATDHPVWSDRPNQIANISTGSDTWRCKECHGWDYKGASGAYGPASSHYTGFPGIFSASSKNAVEVFCDIKAGTANNADHQFNSSNTGGQITDVQILYLTKFITSASTSGGMADSSTFITPGTSTAIGDSVAGQTVYNTTAGCGSASCHDTDGTQNLDGHTMGDMSNDNPWEVLHKIRYGHPNSSMPAFVSSPTLSTTQMQNVLAYAQTMGGGGGGGVTPPSDAAKMVMGGLLYDEWSAELGITPAGTNPLWAFQSTNTRTGTTTWRCKECHGWDYKGAAGAYGPSSSHYTGFPGVLNVAMDSSTSEAEVFDRIRDGFVNPFNGARIHNFGIYLNDTQIDALAYFIKNGGVIDTDPYILSFLKFGLGDATNGLALFSFAGFGVANGNCALCHDDDGQAINFGTVASPEYLGDLARDNPWEVLHKARFGQPDSNMPAMIQSGLTLDDAADVLTHVQSLP